MIDTCLTPNCFSAPSNGSRFCRSCVINLASDNSPSNPSMNKQANDMLSAIKPPAPPEERNGRRSADKVEGENSGGDVDYYRVLIEDPKRPDVTPYMAECEDIIEHLGMDFAEGSAFKSIWRKAAQRTLGHLKRGNDAHGVRDSEKAEYYGKRQVAIAKRRLKKAGFIGPKTTTDSNVK